MTKRVHYVHFVSWASRQNSPYLLDFRAGSGAAGLVHINTRVPGTWYQVCVTHVVRGNTSANGCFSPVKYKYLVVCITVLYTRYTIGTKPHSFGLGHYPKQGIPVPNQVYLVEPHPFCLGRYPKKGIPVRNHVYLVGGIIVCPLFT